MACKVDLTFKNGDKLPAIGLGTWRAPDNEVECALNTALEIGYRHIDCAPVYGNERVIGKVFKEWIASGKIKREDLFITTKLPVFGNRFEDVERCLKQSLADLGVDYLDLYLIHVPFAVPYTENSFTFQENGNVVQSETDHVKTWKEFERLKQAGLIKHLGVSNFNERQIQRLLNNSAVKPEVLQVELHLYFQQKPLVEFCKLNDIIVTAYSPLGSRGIEKLLQESGSDVHVPDLLDNPVVKEIAQRLNKSSAQILLRYYLQCGVSTIPKSTNADRLRSNISIFDFELSSDDSENLLKLDAGIRLCSFEKFSFFKGIETHPEYPF